MWAATARRPSSQEEEGGQARGKVHWPLQRGAWAGRQLTRSSPTYQMFLVRELLAFNKLSYCKSVIRQGKHGHSTSPNTHTSQIFCSNRLFLVSYRSNPGEGTMFHLLNLPIIFQHTEETDVFHPLCPLENGFLTLSPWSRSGT